MTIDTNKPNFQQLESLRSELISEGIDYFSLHKRIFDFFNYFDNVLSSHNSNLIESFLSEFIDEYFLIVKHFECVGVEPSFTEKLIEQLISMSKLSLFENEKYKIQSEIDRFNNQLSKLKDSLNGTITDNFSQSKIYFPLIDGNSPDGFYGLLESVSVRINKATDNDTFLFIPSEKQIEERLAEQCEKSWKLAITTINKFVRKPFKYHEVIISFEKKICFYEGDSLGVALALTFIEELLKFYNPPYQILNKSLSAFTGGITKQGEILNTGEDIIKQKVRTVFFSDIKNFVIPKLEETYAQFTLTQLREKYPERILKIIPAEDFEDILNRRDLVEIKRINPIKRTGKYLAKNWVNTTFLIIILALIYFANLWDFDNNPHSIMYENNKLSIINVNNKKLWELSGISIPDGSLSGKIFNKNYGIIEDIDGDNLNEIILSKQLFSNYENKDNLGFITCFDNDNNILWKYDLNDVVSTKEREYTNEYNKIHFIGIEKYLGKDVLFIIANHKFFPSAVFGLDIKNGERVTDIFWHSGNFFDGIILKDSIKNNIKLVLGGVNNGYESAALVVIDIEKLNGQGISADNYTFKDIPLAEFEEYILLNKSDISNLNKNRYNIIYQDAIQLDGNLIRVATNEGLQSLSPDLILFYYFNSDFTLKFIECTDFFQHKRDILVKEGKLSPPLTYTKEYFDKLREGVLYYKNGEWISSID